MDITAVLASYVHDVTVEQLQESLDAVTGYLQVVREAAAIRDFVDVQLAEQIVDVLRALIADAEVYTARERALLAGSVAYFTKVDDENSDIASPTGLEDDAEVLNAVCRYLGRSELTLEIG